MQYLAKDLDEKQYNYLFHQGATAISDFGLTILGFDIIDEPKGFHGSFLHTKEDGIRQIIIRLDDDFDYLQRMEEQE